MRKIIFLTIIFSQLSCAKHYAKFSNKISESYFDKGQKYERKNNKSFALLYYNKADSAGPNNPAILHTRGYLKCSNGNFREGLSDINRSIELETDTVIKVNYVYNRGTIYLDNKMMDSACADFRAGGKQGRKISEKICD